MLDGYRMIMLIYSAIHRLCAMDRAHVRRRRNVTQQRGTRRRMYVSILPLSLYLSIMTFTRITKKVKDAS